MTAKPGIPHTPRHKHIPHELHVHLEVIKEHLELISGSRGTPVTPLAASDSASPLADFFNKLNALIGQVSNTKVAVPPTTTQIPGDNTFSGFMHFTGPPGSARGHFLETMQVTRWAVMVDNSTESGSNAGSNYGISRYSDTGAFIDEAFSINRKTGVTAHPNGAVLGGHTFATLPASPTAGQRDFITDCNTTTYLAAAAGGGTNKVPVVYNGTAWVVG